MAKHGKQQGKRTDLFMVDPDELVISDDPKHHLYDARAKLPLDEAMVLNVMTYGVIEPVIVAREGNQMIVVDGRRRVLHAREAKKRQAKAGEVTVSVPCAIRRGTQGRLFGVSRSANNFRVDDGPMQNAQNVARMIDLGETEEDAATAFGVDVQTIKNWLKLLDLDVSIQKAVEAGEVGATAASRLAGLAPGEQKTTLAELRKQGKVTIAKTAAKIKQDKTQKPVAVALSKRVLKKLIEHAKEPDSYAHQLDSQFIDGIRFTLGEVTPSRIKGLIAALGEAGYKGEE